MFGLKKEEHSSLQFDLEEHLQNGEKKASLKKECLDAIQGLKRLLREGADTAEFQELTTLLNAFLALDKILSRS